MAEFHERYDTSDKLWALIEPYTIGNAGARGGNAKDTRRFINAVFWILRTGAPWQDLPPSCGKWRFGFCRRRLRISLISVSVY